MFIYLFPIHNSHFETATMRGPFKVHKYCYYADAVDVAAAVTAPRRCLSGILNIPLYAIFIVTIQFWTEQKGSFHIQANCVCSGVQPPPPPTLESQSLTKYRILLYFRFPGSYFSISTNMQTFSMYATRSMCACVCVCARQTSNTRI